jgi:hypothetical protein
MSKLKDINSKLDLYMKGIINEYLDENGVNEIRMYKLRNDWDSLNYLNRKLFDNLYYKKGDEFGSGRMNWIWMVNDFKDRFEIWCKRSGMLEKRERGYKDNSKEIWLVRS